MAFTFRAKGFIESTNLDFKQMLQIFPRIKPILLLFVAFVSSTNAQVTTNEDQNRIPTNITKYVLFWTEMMGNKDFYFESTGFELFEGCKINNCYATNNRSVVPLEDYAALFFYSPTKYQYRNHSLPPKDKRSKKQRYVWANSETPIRFYGKKKVRFIINGYFNWTMSYRLDADLVRSHGYVYQNETTNYTYPDYSTKNKFATIFVSNCNTPGKRELLVKELQKYVNVDVYGKCGNLSCPIIDKEKCYDQIAKTHKFYLSFENSYCKDYITEKFYNALNNDVIPVVYGGGNYTKIAPPSSYINVEDFDSVTALVDHLKKVSENETEYLKYFQWKSHYTIDVTTKTLACQMCEKLHNTSEPEKIYTDIKTWWFDPKNSGCREPKDLPKIVRDLL